ncbi:hypothetical protein [Clostridium felsineum]|uniref:Uncharacterized protein n=1 Tax=Clostridium felsineum TaxID=36839 RepID=A0A1S8M2X4_9CLOT|nr:hypothetical protein [Clostridium felsineum]MCR3760062.1 hypothetical protein [Clostridium felsineum]URZ01398.1 hypothetical protein CLAUR_013880 [Clostridium felsineum]URZ05758.1 hypothetical protein CLROS_010890 [Clostridium felsineum]URZ10797.1 hypothetical protein CROST_015120 [Clostridium felsineum]URZ15549.1 hypothetical protein CLFE_015940 [Clostridium felsineum DSM 794]
MENLFYKILKDTNEKAHEIIETLKFKSEKTILIDEIYSHLINEKNEKIINLETNFKKIESININYQKNIEKLVQQNTILKVKVMALESLLNENINSSMD